MEHRSSFWLFLILGVAVGLSFELLKSPKVETAKFSFFRMEDVSDPEASTTRTRIRKQVRKTIAKSLYRGQISAQTAEETAKLAGLEKPAAPKAPTLEELKAQGEKAVKDAKKADEEKKKKDKKKKKKKKTIEGQGNATPQDQQTPDDERAGESDSAAEGAMADASAPMANAGGVGSRGDDWIPQTQEEWEQYLFEYPDFHRTSRFIKFYQTGLVKAEIIYEVVEHMLADDNVKMRELGVMALGSNPSPMSFKFLVHVTRTEDKTSPVRNQAYAYLRTYTQLKHLSVLASTLSPDAPTEINLEAIRLMELAAEYHLRARTATGGTGQPTEQGGQTPRAPAASAVARQFSPFVTALSRMTQMAPDTGVRSAADQALSNLQNLLGKS